MVHVIDGLDKPITNEAELRMFLMQHLKIGVSEIHIACDNPIMYRRKRSVDLMLDNEIISSTEID